jgi:glyoxylase-like metal-dependent hydrolase (beta-lactamase superfamily II)
MLGVEQIPVGALGTNCYLVWDEGTKEGVVVDPGDNADRILSRIRERDLTITAIIATHCHFDHIGAVTPLQDTLPGTAQGSPGASTDASGTKVPFMIHREEISRIDEAVTAAARWGFRIPRPSDPDRFIADGDVVRVGGEILAVLHTPGHSAGGVSFLHEGSEPPIVIVGDTLFQGSIGRTDFRQGSMSVLDRSIKEKLYVLPDDTIAYTGHGPSTTIGKEKKYNPFVRG